MLILAPGRLAADTLRDRFTARLDRSLSTTPARTWASYAFDLIRRAKAEGILPLSAAAEAPVRPRAGPHHQGTAGGPRPAWPRAALAGGPDGGPADTRFPAGGPAALRPDYRIRPYRGGPRRPGPRGAAGRTGLPLPPCTPNTATSWICACRKPSTPRASSPPPARSSRIHPDFLAAERDRLQLILVDDIQEANPAVFELLADIARRQGCYHHVITGHGGAGVPWRAAGSRGRAPRPAGRRAAGSP